MSMPQLGEIHPSVPHDLLNIPVFHPEFNNVQTRGECDNVDEINYIFDAELNQPQFTACTSELAALAIEEDSGVLSLAGCE